MTKPSSSFFPISLPLCVCFHFERLRQHLVQTIAIDHCKIYCGRDPGFYMHLHLHINTHIIHIQVDIMHIYTYVFIILTYWYIIPDQFCLVVFFKVHFSMLVTHLCSFDDLRKVRRLSFLETMYRSLLREASPSKMIQACQGWRWYESKRTN